MKAVGYRPMDFAVCAKRLSGDLIEMPMADRSYYSMRRVGAET